MFGQIDGNTGETMSYVHFFGGVNKVRNSLWELGMRKGDVMVIFAPNNINTPVMLFAVASIGGIVSPCNILHTAGKQLKEYFKGVI